MILQSLELKDFRNYESLSLQLSPQVTIFVGQNAQGKTNVLESILMLALAKSHRAGRDSEMIRWGADFASVSGVVERNQRNYSLDLKILPRGKKVRVNGLEKRKMSDFIGHLNVVLFAPEDLMLVKGAPQARRRFLDMELGQMSPQYLYNLAQYQKVLQQRNNILKDSERMDAGLVGTLSVWDEQLVEYGAKIIRKRLEFVEKIQQFSADIHQRITSGREELTLQYKSSLLENENCSGSLADFFREQLLSRQKDDFRRGSTSVGPHRDDIEVQINQQNVHTFGSQGQQRTAALSMKLAEIELIRHEVGEYPVLLLDDVLSELDEMRQLHLLESMGERVQTLITTTMTYGLQELMQEKAVVYRVMGGSIDRT
ncbi:DNA replication/repair protein RecF [Effusibacillus lacus]|uniref:DNA replication and repair protein RecF n=1 Tax=Effusibacillus lacus TaxID=1348429 RepID=A0A292YJR0_9BACL|nr:DNA replication/repair protein RecF [Effusibacillus lacus]TCS74406.1 DNA replication and repair protein RecF [Effusibacillus lacus]GAX88720.1 DNA replication/repair protein RecF [Effusibacillus lacus]